MFRWLTRLTCLLALLSVCSSQFLTAQTNPLPRCGTMEMAERWGLNLKPFTESPAQWKNSELDDSSIVRVPVVVHVIHNNGPENLPDDYIYEMLDIMNEAFRRKPGTATDGKGGDAFIEFFLARRDPNGNCHSGINRIQSTLTDMDRSGGDDLRVKNLSRWNPSRYLNIWIVRAIPATEGSVIGYSYFPEMVVDRPNLDGIVLTAVAVGRRMPFAATPVHEAGHYFGLFHTFQDGCVGGNSGTCRRLGDRLCDTPPTLSANFECKLDTDPCPNDAYDVPANVNNYMDYSSDVCMKMFTQDQVDRMHNQITEYRPLFRSRSNWERAGYLDGMNIEPLFASICSRDDFVEIKAFGAKNFTWLPSAGLDQTTGTTVVATPTRTTTYTATAVTGDLNCPGRVLRKTITVFVSESLKVDAYSDDEKRTILATATGGRAPYLFRISPRDPFNPDLYTPPNSQTSTATFKPTIPGNYTIYVRDANGCQNAMKVSFLVSRPNELAFNPFGLQLHPNPANEMLNVHIRQAGNYSYSIMDMTGKTLEQGGISENEQSFKVDNLPEGIYLFQLTDDLGRMTTLKWFKE